VGGHLCSPSLPLRARVILFWIQQVPQNLAYDRLGQKLKSYTNKVQLNKVEHNYQTCELLLYYCVQDHSVITNVKNMKMQFISRYHVYKTSGCVMCHRLCYSAQSSSKSQAKYT